MTIAFKKFIKAQHRKHIQRFIPVTIFYRKYRDELIEAYKAINEGSF